MHFDRSFETVAANKKINFLFAHLYYLAFFYKRERQNIIINSIGRSGTNYIQLVLYNYLNLMFGNGARITFKEFDKIKNIRTKYLKFQGNRTTQDYIKKTGYNFIQHDHDYRFLKFTNAKTIHVYRNPLDNLVSRYNYFKKYNNVEYSQEELIKKHLPVFVEHYKYVRNLKSSNILRLSYEQLMQYSLDIFINIVNFLNIGLDLELLKKALDFSKKDNVKSDENGRKFISSGEIGQWREFFSEKDLEEILVILKKNDISINEFIYE